MTILQHDSATKDSLRANFEDKPAGFTGQCPLQQPKIAIFPVRYAIDEAQENAEDRARHAFPADWQGQQSLPKLNKRTYTLRQLREGWLYVVNRTTNMLDEYQITGSSFSKISDGAKEGSELPSCSASTNYLLYPRDSELLLAYSSVQWTPRTHERMADTDLQARWMRELDLAAYVRAMDAPHCAPLKQLADTVADIDSGSATAGQRFASTTTPSEPLDADGPYKAALGSDTILGSVPDQDSALLIALDDSLGMLDDLSMQAAGPALELAQFESEHMHRLTIAEHVEMLAGADLAELESSMDLSPEAFHEFKQKAQDYLTAKAKHLADAQKPSEFSSVASFAELNRCTVELTTEYGSSTPEQLNSLVEQWAAREALRDQVRFEDSQQFSLEKRQALEAIQAELTLSLEDLITWLEHLKNDPLCLLHDQTDEVQCLNLLNNADAWLSLLIQDQKMQSWLIQDYAAPKTLLGLAHFNFDEELASGIEQLVQEFTEQNGIAVGTAASTAKRTQELVDVLSNETVRHSAVFQGMSQPAQNAYNTLIKVASQHFETLWQGFEYKLLPAVSSRLGPQWKTIEYAAISVSVQSYVDETRPFLVLDGEYKQKHSSWMRRVTMLTRRIDAQSRVVASGRGHDRNAASRDVQKLKRNLEKLTLEMPSQILVSGEAQIQTSRAEIAQRAYAIQSLGRAELALQLELKAKDYGAYLKRVNAWVQGNAAKGLAGILTVLNIWNFHAAMTTAGADGEWSRSDHLAVSVAAGSMLAGLTALTLMPAWSRIAQITGQVIVDQEVVKARLVDAAARFWSPDYAKHSTLFKTFAVRAIAVAGLSVIASAAEAIQLEQQVDGAKSRKEALALRSKQAIVGLMGGLGAFQLAGAVGAYAGAFSVGAVFAPWILIGFAVLGVLYLVSSLVADNLKLEGFKLWLYRSAWSKASVGYWPDTEEGNKDELRALHETLLRPTILAQTKAHGVWLKLVLPPSVAGHNVNIHPVMVTKGGWFTPDKETSYRSGMYATYFSEGRWVDLDQLGIWDTLGARNERHRPWPTYKSGEWRTWLVNVPISKGMDRMDISVQYPPEVLQRPDNLGYRFSVDLQGIQAGKLFENPYVHGHVAEPSNEVRSLVIDGLPPRSKAEYTLLVI